MPDSLVTASPAKAPFPVFYRLDGSEAASEKAAEALLLPTNDYVNSPMTFAGVLSKAECEAIVALGSSRREVSGELARPVENFRKANMSYLLLDAETKWLYERIRGLVATINRWYRFDLVGFQEPIQYQRYEPGDSFGWHVDCGYGPASNRKISISVQLSDPADYEGGGLEFAGLGELSMSRVQGSLIVFPPFMTHQVSPVTRGVRRSMVAWIAGPPFR